MSNLSQNSSKNSFTVFRRFPLNHHISLKRSCSPFFPLWMRNADVVLQSHEWIGKVRHAESLVYTWNHVTGSDPQTCNFVPCGLEDHRINAREGTSHVIRMAKRHIPRCLLYGKLLRGRRHQDWLKRQYKEIIKTNHHLCKRQTKRTRGACWWRIALMNQSARR